MKKDKQKIKEKQMAMAIMAMSNDPLRNYPDTEDLKMIGELLVMAYENYPRFFSFGLVCWRDYKRAKAYNEEKNFEKHEDAWKKLNQMNEVARKYFEAVERDPALKKEFEALNEGFRQELIHKKEVGLCCANCGHELAEDGKQLIRMHGFPDTCAVKPVSDVKGWQNIRCTCNNPKKPKEAKK